MKVIIPFILYDVQREETDTMLLLRPKDAVTETPEGDWEFLKASEGDARISIAVPPALYAKFMASSIHVDVTFEFKGIE